MFTYDDFVKNVRDIISNAGLKQGAVAEKAGFKEMEFSNMLNGRKAIRAEYTAWSTPQSSITRPEQT
jgi:plasmid maintenance system antidote protein VapI